jgi:hypothetical protein
MAAGDPPGAILRGRITEAPDASPPSRAHSYLLPQILESSAPGRLLVIRPDTIVMERTILER